MKVKTWNAIRARLKLRFEAADITSCEFGFDGCTQGFNVGFAHAMKRRFLTSDAPKGNPAHYETCAIACQNCHKILDEKLSHAAMQAEVMHAISERTEQP